MKAATLASLIAYVGAVQLNGIDPKSLMFGPHWRKQWPEGATDNSDEDADVIEEYNVHKTDPKEEPVPHVWYPFEPHTTGPADEHTGMYHTQVYK